MIHIYMPIQQFPLYLLDQERTEKMIKKILLVLFVLALVNCQTTNVVTNKQIQEKIQWLYDPFRWMYWKYGQQYDQRTFWIHKKGLYQSRIHFNIVDKNNSDYISYIRQTAFKFDDNNMFASNLVVYALLETLQLEVTFDEYVVGIVLKGISQFRDKNSPEGVPIYSYWPQTDVNGTWVAQSINLINSVVLATPQGLSKFPEVIDQSFPGAARDMSQGLCIPPDNGDSSLNLILQGLLKEMNSSHSSFWSGLHTKKQEYYERALKYAYRPFGPIPNNNKFADVIDPRTYFVLRELLDKKKQQNRTLILPTTWLLKFDEQVEGIIMMPFRSNNVDASVSANFLFGLCYQLIYGEVKLSPQLRQMALDTTELLEFTITRVLNSRPTLLLAYYPSKYNFYWFVARIVGLLKRTPVLPDPLNQVKTRLEVLMKTVGTNDILRTAVKSEKNGTNWQQFLGNFGGLDRKEDSYFSTGVVLNTLIDTWTTRKNKKMILDSDVPNQIKQTLKESVRWLVNFLLPKFCPFNAIFTGSVKIFDNSYPYFFPANYILDNTGKQIEPSQQISPKNCSVFMKGYVEPNQYDEYLNKKWFGHNVPKEEVSLNSGDGLRFLFWSSVPLTHIMIINGFSKYLRLQTAASNIKTKSLQNSKP